MRPRRFVERHEREVFDRAAEVSNLAIAYDLARVAGRLQIPRDHYVKRRSFRAGNLADTVSRCRECGVGNESGNVVRRDGWNEPGEMRTMVPTAFEAASAQSVEAPFQGRQ